MNTGIICEFNPFHAGHKYLIDKVKSRGDNKVVCIMSGNFVQRGDFAVYDKFARAKEAIIGGADLVIELPPEQALLSAEGFARSAVRLAESLGVLDELAFGAENDDIEELKATSILLEKAETQENIKEAMKSGLSYPAARQKVLKSSVLETPNNILACEYIKETSLDCFAVKRIGKGHDSDDEEYSATQIRKRLSDENTANIKNCETAFLYRLRTMSKDDFSKIADVNEGLENRLYEAAGMATSFEDFIFRAKSKRYTLSRIRRIALRAYLGIEGKSYDVPVIRVLGFNENGKKLLSEIKKNSTKSIITKLSDCDQSNLKYFLKQCEYTDLYNLALKKPLPRAAEQRSQIVVI